MTDREILVLGPEERNAAGAVRGLPEPAADPGFRARLKQEFVSGEFTEPAPARVPRAIAARGVAWWRRPGWVLVPAVATALVVAAGILDRGPAWQLTSASGEGIVVVGYRPIPVGHQEDLSRALRPGSEVRVGEGANVQIMSPGQMVIEITPGTTVRIPPPPGRWFSRRTSTTMGRGELRITTGPAFRGARLEVETPEAAVHITGTTLAVICEPAGTCVCVYDGVVRVGPKGGAMAAVENGHRRFVFNDGRAPEQAEIRPAEHAKLGMFRDQHRPLLAGEK